MVTSHDSPDRPFRRVHSDRLLGGVSGALARRFGVDITTIRLGFVVLVVFGGGGVVLYAAGWLLIPDEAAEVSLAENLVRRLGWR